MEHKIQFSRPSPFCSAHEIRINCKNAMFKRNTHRIYVHRKHWHNVVRHHKCIGCESTGRCQMHGQRNQNCYFHTHSLMVARMIQSLHTMTALHSETVGRWTKNTQLTKTTYLTNSQNHIVQCKSIHSISKCKSELKLYLQQNCILE